MADTSHAPFCAPSSRRSGPAVRPSCASSGTARTPDLTFDGGFADSSQVTAERGEIEALAVSLVGHARDIEVALQKFDDGTYGRCEGCGGQIAEPRLEAMPAARLCITCASKR